MQFDAQDIASRDHRLGKDIKPEPVKSKKPKFVLLQVRPNADSHVIAWKRCQELQSPTILAGDYIRLSCKIRGIDPAIFLSSCRKRHLVIYRKELVKEVAVRYPHLSSTQLGRLFRRDHTTILYLLGRTKTAKRRGLG